MASELAKESQEAADDYLQQRGEQDINSNASAFNAWLSTSSVVDAPLEPFPTDSKPPEKQSTAGRIVRSVSEIPRQVAGGVDDFMRNATTFLNPVTDWLNENVADLRYDPVSAPKTTTGQITRSAAKFLTGFIPALKGVKALGAGASIAPIAAGAISDVLGTGVHEKRLADLWVTAGLPKNVLTDYLSSKPDDSAMESKFKTSLEGVLTGTMLNGVMLGARALRGLRAAGKEQAAAQVGQEALTSAREQYGELTEEVSRKVLGDPKRALVEATGADVSKVRPMDITEAGKPGTGVYINFSRINSPEDVKNVIGTLANKFSGSIKEAQRGVITQKETEKLASDLGLTVEDVLSRRQGQPFNAETAVAARRLWAASAENVLSLAKKAADPNAGVVDQFAFRKSLAAHHAIQAEVIGARTETARALAAWKIPAGGSVENAKALQDVMEASGGNGLSQDIARRVMILAKEGAPGAAARFADKAAGASTMDALKEVWINGLLSSPTTHVVNAASNMVVAFQQVYERGTARLIGDLRTGTDTVAPGEAFALAQGQIGAVKDAWRLAAKSFRTGETGTALGKVDVPIHGALSSDALRISSESGLGRFVDFIGSAARIPGRLLGSSDEFFKTIGYRAEVNAQAVRQATAEGLKGEDLTRRIAELVANPPESIRLAAVDSATYATFTQKPGAVGQAFLTMREKVPASTFIMPFVKTPVNIARYTFERTPFAPLVGQWRADILAGGARADIAMARMATGSTIMLLALDYADSGRISGSGPKDAAEREAMTRQGWQPYSVKVGDRWYSYNRTDPLGSMLGFSADVADRIRRGEINQDDVDEWNEVFAMSIAAVSKTAINKTYLQGMANFFEMMEDPDKSGPKYVTGVMSSFVPFTSLNASIERAVDPTVREADNPWQAIQSRVAGLSSSLPPRRNLWGEEIRTDSGLGKAYDMFSPVQSREVKPSPIDTEIMRLAPIGAMDNVAGAAPQRIGKRAYFEGVEVNFKDWPKQYDQYVKLSGNELKHPAWGVGAHDFLDAMVSGKNVMSQVYKMRSDPMKLMFIKGVIDQYRKLAQRVVMEDPHNRDFSVYVQELKRQKMQSKMPVIGGQQMQLPEGVQ